VCFYCDKPGHIARYCWKKDQDKKQREIEEHRNQTNFAQAAYYTSGDDNTVTVEQVYVGNCSSMCVFDVSCVFKCFPVFPFFVRFSGPVFGRCPVGVRSASVSGLDHGVTLWQPLVIVICHGMFVILIYALFEHSVRHNLGRC